MIKHTFVHIENGKITNPSVLKFLKDGRYKIQSANSRTLDQNAYFHGPVLEHVLDGLIDAGFEGVYNLKDAKAVIKGVFLKHTVFNKNTGDVIETIRDTSDLTIEEFSILIDRVIRWSEDYLGISIPPPNSQAKLF